MICVECAAPVNYLYTYYSEDNIHATKCNNCGNFADKYIECDKVLVVIDLLLLRRGAIRHVVFNGSEKHAMEVFPSSLPPSRSGTAMEGERQESVPVDEQLWPESVESRSDRWYASYVSPAVFRLLLFVALSDVYLHWAMSERSTVPSVARFLEVTPPAIQYAMFLTLSICDTLIVHTAVRLLARRLVGWTDGAAVSASLLIGSFFKLLPILTLIWHYDIPYAEQLVQYFSLACTTEILSITLGCEYRYAMLFTCIGRGASIALYRLFWSLV